MWICNAQYQHCELHQLREVALIVLYNISDRWAAVGDASPPGCAVFIVLLCRPKPSLLIRNSRAYQSNSLQGRDDVFCLVQFTPLMLQGKRKNTKMQRGTSCLAPLTKTGLTLCSVQISISFPDCISLFSHHNLTTNRFTGYSIHTVISSIDPVDLFLLSGLHTHRDSLSPHKAPVITIPLTSPVFPLVGCPIGL